MMGHVVLMLTTRPHVLVTENGVVIIVKVSMTNLSLNMYEFYILV